MSIMIPSTEPITGGQIGKATELLSAKLRKHEKELPSNIVQIVLGDPSLADELFEVIRKKVEAQSDMTVRSVKVNRTLSSQQALDATGRKQYTDSDVVATIPQGDGDEVEVFFFKLGRSVSNDNLEKEYELRGLIPDPHAQMAVNEIDPAFADTHPNGTQWKNTKGKWCFATFNRWYDDERYVGVYQSDGDWSDDWWFGGVRKKAL